MRDVAAVGERVLQPPFEQRQLRARHAGRRYRAGARHQRHALVHVERGRCVGTPPSSARYRCAPAVTAKMQAERQDEVAGALRFAPPSAAVAPRLPLGFAGPCGCAARDWASPGCGRRRADTSPLVNSERCVAAIGESPRSPGRPLTHLMRRGAAARRKNAPRSVRDRRRDRVVEVPVRSVCVDRRRSARRTSPSRRPRDHVAPTVWRDARARRIARWRGLRRSETPRQPRIGETDARRGLWFCTCQRAESWPPRFAMPARRTDVRSARRRNPRLHRSGATGWHRVHPRPPRSRGRAFMADVSGQIERTAGSSACRRSARAR